MKVVLQRVKKASVSVDGEVVGNIKKGLLIFFGASLLDTKKEVGYLVDKVLNLRIFQDSEGKMNRSIKDVGGDALVVSQFTLYADCTKGRRPSFVHAAKPDIAEVLYEEFISQLKREIKNVGRGVFGAYMEVSLVNDGPVTLIVSS